MQVKNLMEDIVWSNVDRIMAHHKMQCGCERCKYDIVALALNYLPPRYFVSQKGETFSRIRSLEQQFNVDVITALSNAIKIVNSDPHHNSETE